MHKSTKALRFKVQVIGDYYVSVAVGDQQQLLTAAKSMGYCLDCTNFDGRKGAVVHHANTYPLMLLSCLPKTIDDYGTLAHECVHAISFIFEDMGEESKDEVFAYCVGTLVMEILKHGVYK